MRQGKKSHVETLLWDGVECVRKTYNDNGDPAQKYRREVGFYQWYETVQGLPRLVYAVPDHSLVLSRIAGQPLAVLSEPVEEVRARHDRDALEQISRDYGRLLAGFFRRPEETVDVCRENQRLYFDGRSSQDIISNTLAAAKHVLDGLPEFRLPEVEAAFENIQTMPSDEAEMLCKLDWNSGNLLVQNNLVTGIIDFEQAFWGNRTIFLGTVIDHINYLHWNAVADGLQEAGVSLPETDTLLSGAQFSLWYKIAPNYRNGVMHYFTPERAQLAFARVARALV